MPDGLTVSNSSCLIALKAVGALDILQQLYSTITVPDAVVQECGAAAGLGASPVRARSTTRSVPSLGFRRR